MPCRDQSNCVPYQELAALVAQSKLGVEAFAGLMGMPYSTLKGKMAGRNQATLLEVNAARFALLRLGHRVDVLPVPAELLVHRAPVRRNQLGRVPSRKKPAGSRG